MNQDFYLKTRSLYEEFQKRELHYLNLERKYNHSMVLKRDLNLPLQEYFEKINQREKETEETYKSILKQMEVLDKHTDSLCTKLDKLGTLQNSIQSLAHLNQSYTLGSYPQNQAAIEPDTYLKSTLSILPVKSDDLSWLVSKSISTQTESATYCDNCKSIFTHCQSSTVKNVTTTNTDASCRKNIDSQVFSSSVLRNDGLNNSELLTSTINDEHCTKHLSQSEEFPVLNSRTESQKNEKHPAESVPLVERQISVESNKVLMSRETKNASENKETIKPKPSAEEIDMSKSMYSQGNVQPSECKSDAESMNNEFDFLESNAGKIPLKSKCQDDSKNGTIPSKVIMSSEKNVSLKVKQSGELPVNCGKDKGASEQIEGLEVTDDRSDTSSSSSGPHSSNVSVVSDSDKSFEKEQPLKASAAYQALLGCTAKVAKTTKSKPESESEDEIESTLASTIQKNSKGALKKAKLSKNTRRALGFETSSSSEEEKVVKLPEEKVDEDDEFDFYD